mmetsp:Transcript_40507/g.97768  ORF Transcript_40507/g.97768 Transcript_40507/m.97768 type:complete len:253 (-) Transcript_40507:472-1230(-)
MAGQPLLQNQLPSLQPAAAVTPTAEFAETMTILETRMQWCRLVTWEHILVDRCITEERTDRSLALCVDLCKLVFTISAAVAKSHPLTDQLHHLLPGQRHALPEGQHHILPVGPLPALRHTPHRDQHPIQHRNQHVTQLLIQRQSQLRNQPLIQHLSQLQSQRINQALSQLRLQQKLQLRRLPMGQPVNPLHRHRLPLRKLRPLNTRERAVMLPTKRIFDWTEDAVEDDVGCVIKRVTTFPPRTKPFGMGEVA